VKSTPTRGVKQTLKPDAYKQWEGVSIQMTGRGFESLDVYARAYALALDVHRATLGFPQVKQFALADQMRRASKSICANIAEGFARQRLSGADWRRFLTMATGSADEMRVWCDFARDLGYVDAETASSWRASFEEVSKMLNELSRAWAANPRP
jgi:four helix bundle protein